jgi:hypothetical protein
MSTVRMTASAIMTRPLSARRPPVECEAIFMDSERAGDTLR